MMRGEVQSTQCGLVYARLACTAVSKQDLHTGGGMRHHLTPLIVSGPAALRQSGVPQMCVQTAGSTTQVRSLVRGMGWQQQQCGRCTACK
jgi:hypothetical protein